MLNRRRLHQHPLEHVRRARTTSAAFRPFHSSARSFARTTRRASFCNRLDRSRTQPAAVRIHATSFLLPARPVALAAPPAPAHNCEISTALPGHQHRAAVIALSITTSSNAQRVRSFRLPVARVEASRRSSSCRRDTLGCTVTASTAPEARSTACSAFVRQLRAPIFHPRDARRRVRSDWSVVVEAFFLCLRRPRHCSLVACADAFGCGQLPQVVLVKLGPCRAAQTLHRRVRLQGRRVDAHTLPSASPCLRRIFSTHFISRAMRVD